MLLPDNTRRPDDGGGVVGWSVHVEIQLEGHPPDDVTQAAAAALVDELTPWSAAAFGGRGMVTLLARQPVDDVATSSDPPAEARALEAALAVVSRFGQVRRVQPVGEPAQAPAGRRPRWRQILRRRAR